MLITREKYNKHIKQFNLWFDHKKYKESLEHLDILNNGLPVKIICNSKKLKELLKAHTFYGCAKCHRSTKLKEITIVKDELQYYPRISECYWLCSYCQAINNCGKTNIIVINPRNLGYIDDMPNDNFLKKLTTRNESIKIFILAYKKELENAYKKIFDDKEI